MHERKRLVHWHGFHVSLQVLRQRRNQERIKNLESTHCSVFGVVLHFHVFGSIFGFDITHCPMLFAKRRFGCWEAIVNSITKWTVKQLGGCETKQRGVGRSMPPPAVLVPFNVLLYSKASSPHALHLPGSRMIVFLTLSCWYKCTGVPPQQKVRFFECQINVWRLKRSFHSLIAVVALLLLRRT